jgi:carbamoyltransferase
MKILGISNTKDSGACLLIDGEMVAAVNEERLSREKLTRVFPTRSIAWLMESYGLTPADVDAVGVGMWKGIASWTGFPAYVGAATARVAENPAARSAIMARLEGSVRSDRQQALEFEAGLASVGLAERPLLQCHHHHAHAITAFEYSPFGEALVVTLDGRGDFMSGSVSTWRRGEQPVLLRTEIELDSLGAFYGWITQYLGFTPDRHEGKVTGLAARGNPEACGPILRRMIGSTDGRLIGQVGDWYAPFMRAELPALRAALAGHSREDIAAGAQTVLEEVASAYVGHYLRQTGARNLCLAGGIFANVLLNQKLRELPGVDGFFVFPHMGDGGIAAGGAAYATRKMGGRVKPMQDAYIGPVFDEKACADAIAVAGLRATRPADLAAEVAGLLDEGLVVGVFQGRMEYGPRALGNRTIMARATEAHINDTLNRRLARSEFMPFAPVTMAEHAADCYVGWRTTDVAPRYMTSCYACTPEMQAQSPAVVHVDGTARPQIVRHEDNPFYHDVLRAYHARTGIPTLINTSFNEHEAPIVCAPEQAVDVLAQDGIDALAMPPFLVRRP